MNQPSKILSLTALGQQLRSGAITCRELIESQLAKVQRSNSSINALVSIDPESALAKADAIDRKLQDRQSLGALAGIPIAVKDNLCTR